MSTRTSASRSCSVPTKSVWRPRWLCVAIGTSSRIFSMSSGLEAGLEKALGGPVAHEALRARAGVDPGRLDADGAPRSGLRRRGDAAERHHLLRREIRHRRAPVDRPLRADPDLCAERALALDDAARDVLGEHLDEERLALDDELDRLLEELGEARHVDALLVGREVDRAVDDRRHHRLGVAAADAHRLLDAARRRRARARARSRATRPGGRPRASRRRSSRRTVAPAPISSAGGARAGGP